MSRRPPDTATLTAVTARPVRGAGVRLTSVQVTHPDETQWVSAAQHQTVQEHRSFAARCSAW